MRDRIDGARRPSCPRPSAGWPRSVARRPEAVAFGTVAELGRRAGHERRHRRPARRAASATTASSSCRPRCRPSSTSACARRPSASASRRRHDVRRRARCAASSTTSQAHPRGDRPRPRSPRAVALLADRRGRVLVVCRRRRATASADRSPPSSAMLRDRRRAASTGSEPRVARPLAHAGAGDVVVAIDLRRYERWVLDAVAALPPSAAADVVAVTDSAAVAARRRRPTAAFVVGRRGRRPVRQPRRHARPRQRPRRRRRRRLRAIGHRPPRPRRGGLAGAAAALLDRAAVRPSTAAVPTRRRRSPGTRPRDGVLGRPPRVGGRRRRAARRRHRRPTPPSPPAPCSPSRPAHVRHGRRPVRPRARPGAPAPPRRSTPSGRAGSGADPDRLRAEGHTRMPFRGDVRGRAGARLRRRLAGAARALRPAAAGRRARRRHRLRRATGSRRRRCSPVAHARAAEVAGADDLLRDRPAAAPATSCAGRASPARSRRSSAGGRAGVLRGRRSATGLLALGGGRVHRRRPAPRHGRLGRAARRSRRGATRLDDPAELAGLPHAARRRDRRGARPARRPRRRPWAHLLVEAARAAGHDRPAVLHEDADVPAAPRRRPRSPRGGPPSIPTARADARSTGTAAGGTIYLCAADGDGMGVSLIQSNAAGFGATSFEPATGIGLHNRGIGFSLEPGHPAEYGPGRRPPHTLSPALVTRPDGVAARGDRHDGRRQPAPDPPPAAVPAACATARHRARPSARRGGRSCGTTGFDTWTDPDGAAVQLEDHAPAAWADGLAGARPPGRASPAAERPRLRPRPRHRRRPTPAGPAPPIPRAEVGSGAAGY